MGFFKHTILGFVLGYLSASFAMFLIGTAVANFDYNISPDFAAGFSSGIAIIGAIIGLFLSGSWDDGEDKFADKGVLESQHAYKKRELDPIKHKNFDDNNE